MLPSDHFFMLAVTDFTVASIFSFEVFQCMWLFRHKTYWHICVNGWTCLPFLFGFLFVCDNKQCLHAYVPTFSHVFRWGSLHACRDRPAFSLVPTGPCTQRCSVHNLQITLVHACVCSPCVCVHSSVKVQMQHAAASHVEHCIDSIMQSMLQF